MKKILLALTLLLTTFTLGYAQSPTLNDKTDVYVGYQFVRINPDVRQPNFKFDRSSDSHGVNGSLTYYAGNGPLGVTGELAANFTGGVNDSSLFTAQGGLTLKSRSHTLQPFIRGLVGVARQRALNEQFNPSTFTDRSDVGLAFTAGAGLDVKVGKTVALRLLQADYLQTRIFGTPVHNLRLGAGVTF